MWCTYDLILADLPKTNNSVEGFHRGFSTLLNIRKPTLWKYLAALRKQQTLTSIHQEQIIGGGEPLPGNF
jgi:hypothetical protein